MGLIINKRIKTSHSALTDLNTHISVGKTQRFHWLVTLYFNPTCDCDQTFTGFFLLSLCYRKKNNYHQMWKGNGLWICSEHNATLLCFYLFLVYQFYLKKPHSSHKESQTHLSVILHTHDKQETNRNWVLTIRTRWHVSTTSRFSEPCKTIQATRHAVQGGLDEIINKVMIISQLQYVHQWDMKWAEVG